MANADYTLPTLVLVIAAVALLHRISAHHSFTKDTEDGMKLFLDICPALFVMICAVVLLRQSELMDILCGTLAAHTASILKETWPIMIFYPIPGSALLAVLVDISQVYGADSLAGNMTSIIQGSTGTTVYVTTLYFSGVGIRRIKNALVAGLLTDATGISMAVLLVLYVFV